MLTGSTPVRRLVVRLPTWVGDAVMATPALRALRRAAPDARLVIHGRPHLAPLLDGSDLFDEWSPVHNGRGRLRANASELRGVRADLAVVLPHSFRSAWEVFLARIPRRIGYRRQGRGFLLTDSLRAHRGEGAVIPVPMVLQYLELVAVLGASGDGRGPRLEIPEALLEAADVWLRGAGLSENDRIVAFNPGASFGPSKIYPIEPLARVADSFGNDPGTRTLILCGPGEEELARSLEMAMSTRPVNTADHPLPLDLLKAVLRRANLLISTDTGPRHIAIAVDTPVVVLMGPTDPRYTGSHLGSTIVLRKEVSCSPCHLKVCPIDHRCMFRITPEEVVEAGRTLLRTGD